MSGRPVSPSSSAGAALAGCGGTTPAASIDLNPTWSYLTNQVTVTPAAGCSPTSYYYWVLWPGAMQYVQFAGPRTESFAYLDTTTHTGTGTLAVNACDAGGCSNYQYLDFTMQVHAISCGSGGCWYDAGTGFNLQDTAGAPNAGWVSAYIYYGTENTLSNATHQADCVNSPGMAIYPYVGGFVRVPGDTNLGAGFAQTGFGFNCYGYPNRVFALFVTNETVHCFAHGSVPAHDVSPSRPGATEYLSCNYSPSDLGIVNGGIYNFDIHTYSTIAYQGINGQALISAPVSAAGITGVYISTEITSGRLNMGGMMNIGLFVNSWFQRAYYSTDDGATWPQFPATGTNVQINYPGSTLGVGNDLYCDRPDGTWRGYGGYSSALLYSMNVRNRCD